MNKDKLLEKFIKTFEENISNTKVLEGLIKKFLEAYERPSSRELSQLLEIYYLNKGFLKTIDFKADFIKAFKEYYIDTFNKSIDNEGFLECFETFQAAEDILIRKDIRKYEEPLLSIKDNQKDIELFETHIEKWLKQILKAKGTAPLTLFFTAFYYTLMEEITDEKVQELFLKQNEKVLLKGKSPLSRLMEELENMVNAVIESEKETENKDKKEYKS